METTREGWRMESDYRDLRRDLCYFRYRSLSRPGALKSLMPHHIEQLTEYLIELGYHKTNRDQHDRDDHTP
jgi:hypothetical protein